MRALLAMLCALLPVIGFAAPTLSSPLPAASTQTAISETSIAQMTPGTTLHYVKRRQAAATLHPRSETSSATLKKMAEDAATAHTLPVNYFLRLIRQESGFNPDSISPAGAQGIAQFMPATAGDRGLKDPFDPSEALPKSAELLSELKDRFGNLGLAAAAYNAGPDRIRKWLAGQSQLPQETINYVRIITGHDAADWAKSNDLTINLGADTFEPSPRLHINRLSWEAQLLATLRAASADASAASPATVKLEKTTLKSGEVSLCSNCIVQSAY